MFEKSTVIVVGAGASKEAGLPTGQELKTQIVNLLDIKFDWREQKSGDVTICEALRLHVKKTEPDLNDINPHLRAARHICDAMPQAISIDNFIDAHSEDKKIELCGKLAIVRSILYAEKQSLLYFDSVTMNRSQPDFKKLEGTWYNLFFQLLTENCRKQDLLERAKRVVLIVFNYDRCIEHFIYHALQNYYKISPQEAGNIASAIKIYHPYGKVGALPWQGAGGAVEFGTDPSAAQLLDFSTQIKTFTEGTDPASSEIVSIRRNMLDSSIVVFLGFAFHRLNMRLIRPDSNGKSESKSFFATARGISSSDCKQLESELGDFFVGESSSANVRNDLTCFGLFQEYWRSLSFS